MILFCISFVIRTVFHSVWWAIPQTVLTIKTRPRAVSSFFDRYNKQCRVTKILFSFLEEPKKNIKRNVFLRTSGTENKAQEEVGDFSTPI